MDKLYEDMMDDILADYGIVDEAKRIKGKEYKIHKGLDRDPDDRTGSDDNSKTNTVGSTSLGSTVIDSSVQKYISNIDVEKEKSIVESENILNEYSTYVGGHLTSAIEKAIKNDLDRAYENSIIQKFKWLFGDSIEEANLPGVNNDDDDDNDFTVDGTDDNTQDDADTDTTDDPGEEDNDFAVDDAGGDEDTDTTDDAGEGEDNTEDTGEEDAGEDDYTLPDAGEEGEDAEGGEDTGEEDDNNFDVDDAGEGEDNTDAEGNDPGADAGGATGDDDLIGGNGSGEDVSDDVQIPNLRDVQQKLFDQLTPEQQQIKVEELKKNYAELYSRCANILKIITDSNPGDDNTVKVFDYVQKTMNDLQTHIYYYISNTFDTKTYIENDIQFKQFLTILNTIKKILDEINTEKKE